jgi:hypothetical protein
LKTSTLDAQRTVSPATGPFPCFTTYRTIANSLDAGSVGWQYYTYSTPVGKRARNAGRATTFGRRSPRSKQFVAAATGQM